MVESSSGVVELYNHMGEGFEHTVLVSNHEVKVFDRMVEPCGRTLLLSSRS